MTADKIADLARKTRQMAEALQAATAGKFEEKTSEELWEEYGAETEFDDAKVYQAADYIAVWTQDQTIEVWDHEGFGDEPPRINLQTGQATF